MIAWVGTRKENDWNGIFFLFSFLLHFFLVMISSWELHRCNGVKFVMKIHAWKKFLDEFFSITWNASVNLNRGITLQIFIYFNDMNNLKKIKIKFEIYNLNHSHIMYIKNDEIYYKCCYTSNDLEFQMFEINNP